MSSKNPYKDKDKKYGGGAGGGGGTSGDAGGGSGTGGGTDGGTGGGAGTPPSFDLNELVLKELRNLGAFPRPDAAQPAGGGGAPHTASLQRTVEDAIKSVLGRLPRSGDHRSFVAALNMSFTYKETPSGGGRYEWTPRTYIGRTDLGGGVTGAQASLVTFAQSAYDNSITLLDGLETLITDTDEEEVEASKAIVRSLWTEFVNELGKEGGPRAARVDSHSSTLLGEPKQAGNVVLVQNPIRVEECQLTLLGVLLGLVETGNDGKAVIEADRPKISRARVVTTEEEANLTNFVSMSDYMYSVQAAWKNYLRFFFQKDLGTGLVLLSRLLSVLAETVDEVYRAMDSVYIGPAERLTIRVDTIDESLSVEELLSWVHTFATEEAPHLIQDGGSRGVRAIKPTATLLQQQVAAFVDRLEGKAPPPAGGAGAVALPDGLAQPRVLNPLKDVKRYLEELLTKAKLITE